LKKNLISAIAGWKSAALLALVAMVAAVAFSGVLTSTSADAQNGPTVVVDGLTYDGTNVDGQVSLDNPPMDDSDPPVVEPWWFRVTNAATNAEVIACTSGSTTITAPATATDGTAASDLALGAAYVVTAYDEDCSSAVPATALASATISMLPEVSGTDLEASPGDTVDVTFSAIQATGKARITFALTSDGADGSFAATGTAAVTCTDDNACDLTANVEDLMTVRVSVGEDSTTGQNLYLAGTDAAADLTIGSVTIAIVDPAAKAAGFTAKPAEGDESVAAGGKASATIEVTVTDDATPAEGFEGHPIIFVTTAGDLKCGAERETSKTCSEPTGSDGVANAEVYSAAPGTVTVTVLAGALGAKDVEVTFFGAAADVSASSEQSSVEFGGSLTVTLTVTDADGRAVVGAPGAVGQPPTDAIEGPADDAKGVSVKLAAADDETDPPQYCGDDAGTDGKGQCVVVVSAAGAPNPATGGAWTINFSLASTDAEGKPTTLTESITLTVAGPPHSIADDAEERYDQRAVATVTLTVTDEDGNLVGTQPISVDVVDGSVALLDEPTETKNGEAPFTFVVRSNAEGSAAFLARSGDAASIIEIDLGPAPVEVVEEVVEEVVIPALAAPTSVTIAASDDGVLSVSASGAAEGDTTEAEVRANGGAWAAVSEEAAAPGTYQARARFVRGDESTDWVYSSNVVVIPEPEPEPEPPTWNNELVSGQNLVVWNGEDGADASAGAAEGVTAIWSYNTGSGTWDGYFPTAADVPGGNTLSTLSNGQAYVVIVE
jgi:hypothetical protein